MCLNSCIIKWEMVEKCFLSQKKIIILINKRKKKSKHSHQAHRRRILRTRKCLEERPTGSVVHTCIQPYVISFNECKVF